jgi:hypothetical protein
MQSLFGGLAVPVIRLLQDPESRYIRSLGTLLDVGGPIRNHRGKMPLKPTFPCVILKIIFKT